MTVQEGQPAYQEFRERVFTSVAELATQSERRRDHPSIPGKKAEPVNPLLRIGDMNANQSYHHPFPGRRCPGLRIHSSKWS